MGLFSLKSNRHEWLNGYSFEDQHFTPDMANLERKAFHRLFVYNNWQHGQHGHDQLGGEAIRLAAAVSTDRDFVVLKKKLGKETYPIALDLEAEKYTLGRETFFGPRGQILGQLFYVRPSVIKELDKQQLNGIEFSRERINIDVPFREHDGTAISDPKIMRMDAWAYIGRTEYWIDGHGITDQLFAPVRRCVVVASPLNQLKETAVRYYYNDKFEIEGN